MPLLLSLQLQVTYLLQPAPLLSHNLNYTSSSSDSGVDRNNCYFCNSSSQCSDDSKTPSSRTIHKYWFMSSGDCSRCGRCGFRSAGTRPAQACGNNIDQDGHGSHVAGTIVGNSMSATTPATNKLNGIAAGASVFFQDIHNGATDLECNAAGLGDGCGDGLYPPTDLYYLFKPAFDAGARIHSNSWGCATSEEEPFACNVYSNQAKHIDDFVHTHQDFLVLVAAGNDGQLAAGYTVGAPATCKNCLSVGASQLNADQVAADAVYIDPSMFCDHLASPPSCCKAKPPTCTRKDCCDAAAAAGSCAPCCDTPCSLTSANNLAEFSSKGPTFDSRFKPDIVAPGEHITSACAGISPATAWQAAQADGSANHCDVSPTSTTNRALTSMSGTSMATPLMAGALEYASLPAFHSADLPLIL
jgi:serine protease AprX